MRARVRKDANTLTVGKTDVSTPWVVRAASTLPSGAPISNPLFGDDPAGTVAVYDTGGTATLEMALDAVQGSAAALLVFDKSEDAQAAAAHGYTPFTIDACELFFAASYELPKAPWLKADLQVGSSDPGSLKPDQSDKFLRTQTKTDDGDCKVGLLSKSARVEKTEDGNEERYILGVVLEPDSVDSQGDTISAAEIRQAAHRYMEEHGNVGLQHQVFVNGKINIIESYVSHVDFTIGTELVKAGTWLMAFRVVDDSIWEAVKSGTLDGLSIGGIGLKIPLA